MVAGFGIGQGSMLAAQTILLAQGQAEQVAGLGIGITIVSLAYHTTDFSGTTVLARRSVHEVNQEFVCSAICGRALVGAAVSIAIALSGLLLVRSSPYFGSLLLGAVLGVIPWSANLTGVLDAQSRSGQAGILAGIPWLAASVASIIFRTGPDWIAGVSVGLSFSLGSIGALIGHWWAMKGGSIGFPRRFETTGAISYLKEATPLFIGWIPGQLYARVQLLVISAALGNAAAAPFVYIRQVITASQQLLLFVRRVEFPRVVAAATHTPLGVLRSLHLHRLSIYTALASAGALAFAGAAIRFAALPQLEQFSEIAHFAVILSPTLPAAAMAAGFGQILIAQSKQAAYSTVIYASLVACIGLLAWQVAALGIFAVLLGELAMSTIQIGGFYSLSRTAPSLRQPTS